jgi:hypothetical protein
VAEADVFDEDGFEVGGGRGGGEGSEGRVDLVPLDRRLTYEDAAEGEGVVGSGDDSGAGAGEGDVGRRGGSCGDGEEALTGARLRWREGEDYGAGCVTGEGGGAVGCVGEVAGEGEGEWESYGADVGYGDGCVVLEVLVTRTALGKLMVAGVTVRLGLADWPMPVGWG